jgi:aldehyde:ferredoxin oxidoreductase
LLGIPIDCVHIAALKTAFSTYYEFKVRKVSYDYEPIYSPGSNMGVGQAEGVLQLIDVCERLGVSCLREGPLLGLSGPWRRGS